MSATGAMRKAISELERERTRLSDMLTTLYKAMPRRRRASTTRKKKLRRVKG